MATNLSTIVRSVQVHAIFNYSAEVAYRSKGGLSADVRGNPNLDGLGALGDIGWYCARGILWAYGYEMPKSVTAHPGALFNEKGVIVSCGATFVWADGRTATFTTSFNSCFVMKLLVVGENGSLENDDFVLPACEERAGFKVVSNTSWKDALGGWNRTEDVQEVTLQIPQEAHMVREFARLVAGIRDGSGGVEPRWAEISRKTQVLLDAVKDSIANGLKTIDV
jgi:predicted dehydrogenase